jgi:hypothetical protein
MNGLPVGCWWREVERHLVVIGPLVQRRRDELASVVDLDSFWHYATQVFDPLHHRHDCLAQVFISNPQNSEALDYFYLPIWRMHPKPPPVLPFCACEQ